MGVADYNKGKGNSNTTNTIQRGVYVYCTVVLACLDILLLNVVAKEILTLTALSFPSHNATLAKNYVCLYGTCEEWACT